MRPLFISVFLKLTLEKFLQLKPSSQRPNINQFHMRVSQVHQYCGYAKLTRKTPAEMTRVLSTLQIKVKF